MFGLSHFTIILTLIDTPGLFYTKWAVFSLVNCYMVSNATVLCEVHYTSFIHFVISTGFISRLTCVLKI